jgi:hypothetical protein
MLTPKIIIKDPMIPNPCPQLPLGLSVLCDGWKNLSSIEVE